VSAKRNPHVAMPSSEPWAAAENRVIYRPAGHHPVKAADWDVADLFFFCNMIPAFQICGVRIENPGNEAHGAFRGL